MKWQDLNKWLLSVLGAGGVITLAILFSGLGELSGVDVTYHSPDQVCQECMAEIHINTTYWEICYEHSDSEDILFKKQSRSRRLWVNLNKVVLTEPEIETQILVPTYGNKLRPIKDGDCNRRYTQSNPRVSKIYIKGNPNGETIKWGVPFLKVDPVWIGWKPTYENLSKEVEIWKFINITVPSEYNEVNKTWSKEYTYPKRIYSHTETQYYQGKRKGVKVAGKEYLNSNVNGNTLYKCNFDVGDRNWDEFPKRNYEIEKGVCEEIELLES